MPRKLLYQVLFEVLQAGPVIPVAYGGTDNVTQIFRKQYQYQAYFAPVFVTVVAAPPQFYPVYPDWLPHIYPRATYNASFFAPVSTDKEATSVDKWWEVTNQPTRLLARTALGQFTIDPNALTQKEAVHIEVFRQPEYPNAFERKYPEATYVASGQSPTPPPETISIDRFGPNYPNWLARRYPEATYVASGQSPLPYPFPEVVSIDKFKPDYPDQIVRTPSRVPWGQYVIDPKILTQRESVSIDKFKPDYPDQLNRTSRLAALIASGISFVPNPIVSIDSFKPEYADYISRKFNEAVLSASGGILAPFVTPTVTIALFAPSYPSQLSAISHHASLSPGTFEPVLVPPTPPPVIAAEDTKLRLGYSDVMTIGDNPQLGGF